MYRQVGIRQAVGDEIFIDDTNAPSKYCEVKPGMCVTAALKNHLDSLNCKVPAARGYSTRGGLLGLGRLGSGLGKVCTIYSGKITMAMLERGDFDECQLKNAKLPVCKTPAPPPPKPPPPPQNIPVETFDEPELPPEEEPEEDNDMYMIGGLLAVLVVGGVGYAVFRNRKKKGRR